jgi:serine/threonine-protein kinase HipA
VQVVAAGDSPDLAAAEDAAEVPFAELLARVIGRTPEDRVGLPGVQDKLSGRMIALPAHWRGVPSILKLDPPEFPHLVANEAFFYAAAVESGIPVAEVEVVHDAAGASGLLVRRFDRVRDGQGFRAVGQEDGCQVLDRYPADKYRLTSEEVLRGLAGATAAPIVAGRELLRQVAFAFLTCNGDAHAKNFSIVQREGEWRVSPAYDLPSSHPYGDTTVALSIAGRSREDIGRSELIALGLHLDVPERATCRVLDALLDHAPRWIERLDALPLDGRRIHRLRRAIRYRAERLGRRAGR